jgi:hypothetical protein
MCRWLCGFPSEILIEILVQLVYVNKQVFVSLSYHLGGLGDQHICSFLANTYLQRLFTIDIYKNFDT